MLHSNNIVSIFGKLSITIETIRISESLASVG
jgi:hypothetical protein